MDRRPRLSYTMNIHTREEPTMCTANTVQFNTTTPVTPISDPATEARKAASRSNALNLLCDAYREQFCEWCYADDRMTELLHMLAAEYVSEELDVITDEDAAFDLSFKLMDSLILRTV